MVGEVNNMSNQGMDVRMRGRATAFVVSCVDVLKARLTKDLYLSEAAAATMAREMAHEICAANARSLIYIPADIEFDLSDRDRQIYAEFNGRNMQQVVAKYKITPQWVYAIVKKVRKEELAARQSNLPGID